MTTNQKIRLNMYLAVRNFVIMNEAIVKDIPKFASTFTDLQNNIAEIQLISELQGVNKTGLALDKKKLRKKLIALAIKNSNKVAILATLSNNETLLKEVRINESNLVKLPGVTLKEQVQIIYDKAEANIGNLAEQGITPDTQKQFLETITEFNNAIAKPRTGIVEKRKATQKLTVLFDTADSLIDIMDLAAGSAKDEQPDFFNGYKTSRKLVDSNTGIISLKATAKELTSGAPVKGASFKFIHAAEKLSANNGNGEITRKTAKRGSFHIKNMPAGTYKVLISKPGYKEKEASVSVADGERSKLVIELERA